MADNREPKPSFVPRLCQVFREHTGMRISTLTAIVYAGLSFVFGLKAAADRPNNVVPMLQCAASVCLSGLSAYGAKHHYHSHFNESATKYKLGELEERTRRLEQHAAETPNTAPR